MTSTLRCAAAAPLAWLASLAAAKAAAHAPSSHYEPSQGKIIFNGQDIAHLKPRQMQPVRRNMQMIFQDPYASLNARMTVRDIIAEPLKAHHVCKSKQEVDEKVFAMLNRVA